jgi:hypothetical protein
VAAVAQVTKALGVALVVVPQAVQAAVAPNRAVRALLNQGLVAVVVVLVAHCTVAARLVVTAAVAAVAVAATGAVVVVVDLTPDLRAAVAAAFITAHIWPALPYTKGLGKPQVTLAVG